MSWKDTRICNNSQMVDNSCQCATYYALLNYQNNPLWEYKGNMNKLQIKVQFFLQDKLSSYLYFVIYNKWDKCLEVNNFILNH